MFNNKLSYPTYKDFKIKGCLITKVVKKLKNYITKKDFTIYTINKLYITKSNIIIFIINKFKVE
jgi:hypothetical protein